MGRACQKLKCYSRSLQGRSFPTAIYVPCGVLRWETEVVAEQLQKSGVQGLGNTQTKMWQP
jgi:hypothetical protein